MVSADLLSDAVFDDLVFLCLRGLSLRCGRQKQDGGDNIYMASTALPQISSQLSLKVCFPRFYIEYNGLLLEELCFSSIEAEKMDVRGAALKQLDR